MSGKVVGWAFERPEKLSPTQRFVLVAIADNADQYGRAWPSRKELARKTGLGLASIYRAIDRLAELGLFEERVEEGREHFYLTLSQGEKIPSQSEKADSQSEKGDSHGAKSTTYKEPSVEPSVEPSPDVARLCELMAKRSNERSGRKRPYTVTKTGLDEMRRLIQIDGRDVVEIEKAIEWVHRDDFWGATCWSPENLRRNYDTMRQQAQRTNGRRRSVGPSSNDLRGMAAQLESEGK